MNFTIPKPTFDNVVTLVIGICIAEYVGGKAVRFWAWVNDAEAPKKAAAKSAPARGRSTSKPNDKKPRPVARRAAA